ncbi:MAG: HIT family protein [Haloarculaceae archaeon]
MVDDRDEDCLFCRIVAGEIPSRTVHEDEDTFAFLDVNPLARGHTLVVPKAHHSRVSDLPDDTAAAVFAAMSELAPAVERAVDADGMTVAVNDGEAAGQEIPHVHGHLVPRFEGDGAGGVHALRWNRPDLGEDASDDVAAAIRDAQ